MTSKSKLKKIIQIPLAFHHQDIHERLDKIEESIFQIQAIVTTLLIMQKNDDRNQQP